MAAPNQIKVFTQDKFTELGYVPQIHPEGYIYFAKREPLDTSQTYPSENNIVTHNVPIKYEEQQQQLVPGSQVMSLNKNVLIDEKYTDKSYCNITNHSEKVLDLKLESDEFNCLSVCKTEYNSCTGKQIQKDICHDRAESSASYVKSKTTNRQEILKYDSDKIVQPRPDLPDDMYMRGRPHNSIHVESWQIKLESMGYISCHFQNCRFIAMSLKDMSQHYRFCRGDSSFAKFSCTFCDGAVTSQQILDIHIARSHAHAHDTFQRPLILRRKSVQPLQASIDGNEAGQDGDIYDDSDGAMPIRMDPTCFGTIFDGTLDSWFFCALPENSVNAAHPFRLHVHSDDIHSIIKSTPNIVPCDDDDDRQVITDYSCCAAFLIDCEGNQSDESQLSADCNSLSPNSVSHIKINENKGGLDQDPHECDNKMYTIQERFKKCYTVKKPIQITAHLQKEMLSTKRTDKRRSRKNLSVASDVQNQEHDNNPHETSLREKDTKNKRNSICDNIKVRRDSINTGRLSYRIRVKGNSERISSEEEIVSSSKNQITFYPKADITASGDGSQMLNPNYKENNGQTEATPKERTRSRCSVVDILEKSKESKVTIGKEIRLKTIKQRRKSGAKEKEHGTFHGESANKKKSGVGDQIKFCKNISHEDKVNLNKMASETKLELSQVEPTASDSRETTSSPPQNFDKKQTKDKTTKKNIPPLIPITQLEMTRSKNEINESYTEERNSRTSVNNSQTSLHVTEHFQDYTHDFSTTSAKVIKHGRQERQNETLNTTQQQEEHSNLKYETRAPLNVFEKTSKLNKTLELTSSAIKNASAPATKTAPIILKPDCDSVATGDVDMCPSSTVVHLSKELNSKSTCSIEKSEINSVIIKRKPGRPKRDRNSLETAEKLSPSMKVKTDTKQTEKIVEPSTIFLNKEIDDKSIPRLDVDHTEIQPAIVKRKPGRPKRDRSCLGTGEQFSPSTSGNNTNDLKPTEMTIEPVLNTDNCEVTNQTEPTIKRKRGRPKRCRDVDEKSSTPGNESKKQEKIDLEIATTPIIKRKVGRPPKSNRSVIETDESCSSSTHKNLTQNDKNIVESESDSDNSPIMRHVTTNKRRLSHESSSDVALENSEGTSQVPTKTKRPRMCWIRPPNDKTKHLTSVTCGKCNKTMPGKSWLDHNDLNHAGLSWLSTEEPFDPVKADRNDVMARIRAAFRTCKSATCDVCGATKKSFLGFHAHVTLCGVSVEEREKSMMKCDICGKAVMHYSMSAHMRIHDTPDPEPGGSLSKRRSAIKALTNLKSIIDDDSGVYFYKKGDSLPECIITKGISFRLGHSKNMCQREGCSMTFENVKQAAEHYMNCQKLPNEYYFCSECLFIDQTKEAFTDHDCSKENYDVNEEEPADNEEDDSEGRVKKTIDYTISYAETQLRRQFIWKEKLGADTLISQRAFEMELARQTALLNCEKEYPNLTTCNHDWAKIVAPDVDDYLPPIRMSLPIGKKGSGHSPEQPYLFQPLSQDNIGGFAGGPIQTLAWCPMNMDRCGVQHQYLALSTSSQAEEYPRILSTTTETALLQIWDVGPLTSPWPKMTLGIAMEYGELWSIAWSPNDCSLPAEKERLARIGLIATACHDGVLRIYSISSPSDGGQWPVYKVEPAVELRRNSETRDSCLRVVWGNGGTVCGGFLSGNVCVWYLSGLTSTRTTKRGKTYVLCPARTFLAHTAPISSMVICPNNQFLLATGGIERKIKFWDLRNLATHMRMEAATMHPHLRWMRHWPIVLYQQDDNFTTHTMPQCLTMTSRTLKVPSTIVDIAVSDWTFTSAYGSSVGELIIRQHLPPFYDSKKKTYTHILAKATANDSIASYAEAESKNTTILFSKLKSSGIYGNCPAFAAENCLADFNLTSVDKVSINPNYRTFDYVAVGYKCGLFRLVQIDYITNIIKSQISPL